MIHGPCGIDNSAQPCMVNGECKRNFPMAYQEETQITDGYPKYRRRRNGNTVTKNGQTIDNQFCVTYNKYLLLRYNCHINCEIVTSIKAVKYLCKYFTKGSDKIEYRLQRQTEDNQPIDEIKNFQDARFLTASEGVWRLFGFPLSAMNPAVIRLDIHLPGENMVRFSEEENIEEVCQLYC